MLNVSCGRTKCDWMKFSCNSNPLLPEELESYRYFFLISLSCFLSSDVEAAPAEIRVKWTASGAEFSSSCHFIGQSIILKIQWLIICDLWCFVHVQSWTFDDSDNFFDTLLIHITNLTWSQFLIFIPLIPLIFSFHTYYRVEDDNGGLAPRPSWIPRGQ